MANSNEIVIKAGDIPTFHLLILNALIYMGAKKDYSGSDRQVMNLMSDLLHQCTRIRNDKLK